MANGEKPISQPGKGKAFFDHGDQSAEISKWDYAIKMYLEGLRREPNNLERGHQKLREISLKRKLSGGKPAGLFNTFKTEKPGHPDVEHLLKVEYILAMDPGNVSHMMAVAKAMEKVGDKPCTKWILDILFDAERQAPKHSKRILTLLAESYARVDEFALAVTACDMARRLAPDDGHLENMSKTFSAQATMKHGQYDGQAGFEKSVLNMDKQKELSQVDSLAKSDDYLQATLLKAKKEYEADPDGHGKVDAYVEALTRFETDEHEKTAMLVLAKAHQQSKAYRFKLRQDDVRMRQYRRHYNLLKSQGKIDEAVKHAREQLEFELRVYKERADQYPTDLNLKYELGRRQLAASQSFKQPEQLDNAIANLQQAQRDPKRRIQAMIDLGRCFDKKRWFKEAADTYSRALENDLTEERSKELRYLLGCAFRAMSKKKEALDQFSEVAQVDFTFRDVRKQIEELRKEMEGGSDAGAAGGTARPPS
jgi:tetratricopeptide (TPR) repeat protein